MKRVTARAYATAIRAALRREYGDTGATRRAICRVAGASEGTVKNWLAGTNAPNGEYLIKLMAASDEVWDAVIAMACRSTDGVEPRRRLKAAREALRTESGDK